MRRVSMRRFRQLPHGRDIVVDSDPPVRRWQFVYSALGAILASTTPGGRFLILRNGFVAFQTSGVFFELLSTMKFSGEELRAIWDGLQEYVTRFEAHMQPGLEQLYQLERLKFSSDIPRVEEVPVDLAEAKREVIVEKVDRRDGYLRRVQ